MRKKRIVHITTVHQPFDTRIFYKECKTLSMEGYEVYLIHKEPTKKNFNKYEENDIKPIFIKNHKSRVKRILYGSREALSEALRLKADVYHIHDPELLLITNKLKNTDAKVIYDMHEDYFTSISQKRYIPNFLRNIIAFIFSFYEKVKLRKLEIILAEKYYKEKHPKGIEVLNYPIIKDEPNEIAYSSDSNKLLYTGNVTIDRGALNHAAIISYVPGITISLIGKCSSILADEMMTISNDKERINIKGIDKFIAREEIDKEYSTKKWIAGLAIFPPSEHYRRKELTKFFEYMNAGLPIIASDFPAWREFIKKYDCGILVEHNNKDQIKNAINFLKQNPDRGRMMGLNGQKAVLNELNWNQEAKKLIRIYRNLIK